MGLTVEDLLCTMKERSCIEFCASSYGGDQESCKKFCRCLRIIYARSGNCREALEKCKGRHLGYGLDFGAV